MRKNVNDIPKFVKTQDLEIATAMTRSGFQLVDYQEETGFWTFINNPDNPLIFDDNKVTYSNMLCI